MDKKFPWLHNSPWELFILVFRLEGRLVESLSRVVECLGDFVESLSRVVECSYGHADAWTDFV